MRVSDRSDVMSLALTFMVAAGLTLAGCGEGGVPDPKYPYGPFSKTVVGVMAGQVPLLSSTSFQAGVVGETEIDGETYSIYVIGHDIPEGGRLDQTTPGSSAYVRGIGTDRLTVAGFSSEIGIYGIADTPLVLDLNPPVGEAQIINTTANITTDIDTVGRPATLAGTYTLVEDDVTVTTSRLGSVSGCRHFQGAVSMSGDALPAIVTGRTVNVDVWYHPDLGIVDLVSNELGINLGQEGQNDWIGPDDDGIAVGRMLTVLDAVQTSASIYTFDRAQALDADMCVHCRMLVEIRYANESDALTLGEPDPTLFSAEFRGGWGQFCWGGCPLVESDVSIFHPEDNGKGYKFWYAYVSQALKNEYVEGGDKGSSYGILVTTDPSLPPVRVTARIAYALASESSDCSM